jgi:hypothetical protein
MTGRSTTGYLVEWNGNLISWRSKKQSLHSLSSTEAEYFAMSDLVKELLWLRMVVETSLDLIIPPKLPIFEDNQATILLANNESNHSSFKTKHMNLLFHFVCSEIIGNQVELHFNRTHLMLADFLTKTIGRTLIFKALQVLNAAMPSAHQD